MTLIRDADVGSSGKLRIALTIMIASQALVVIASLALPVLAAPASLRYELPSAFIGLYTGLLFGTAMLSALASPPLVERYGAIRVSQSTLMLASMGLLACCVSHRMGLAFSAIAIGLAYGPANPASSALLRRLTHSSNRARVFSLKQTSVPIGGASSGILIPYVWESIGWTGTMLVLAVVCLATAFAIEPWRLALECPDDQRVSASSANGIAEPIRFVCGTRDLLRIAIMSGGFAAVQFTFMATVVAVLIQSGGFPLPLAGLALSVAMAASLGMRIAFGFLADRAGGPTVLTVLATIMVVGAIAFAALNKSWPIPLAFTLAVALGISCLSWNGVYLAEVAARTNTETVAKATAGCMTFTFLGGLIGPTLFAASDRALGGTSAGFLVIAAIAMCALVAIQSLRHRPAL